MKHALKPESRLVVLPDGTEVTLDGEQPWWTVQDNLGYVSPDDLAPDPKQPRKNISEAQLAELQVSVATRGVRQPLTVTPRSMAPWAVVRPEHEGRFFLIVSGHRRCLSAERAGIGAVPVQVKIYPNEAEHRLDASILNKGREDVSPLDQGYEMVDLRAVGCKIETLMASFGYTATQVYTRMNLTKLHPDIQELVKPELHGGRVLLPITTAGVLGGVSTPSPDELTELRERFSSIIEAAGLAEDDYESFGDDERRFILQKMLLAVIRKRSLGVVQATEFIREHTLHLAARSGGAGRKTERYQPRRRQELVHNYLKGVTANPIFDWKVPEWERIFGLVTREEVDSILAQVEAGRQSLAGVERILTKIRDSKKQTSAVVLEALERRKRAS